MSRVDRRTLLKTGAAGGIALAAPAAALRGEGKAVVYDSRIPEALAFARTVPQARAIDVSIEHHTRFTALRAGQHPARIHGLTGWDDWVAIRGELEAQGYRLAAEAPATARLFRWTMRRR